MSPDQIVLASDAMYRGSRPIQDGGCEMIMEFMVPTRGDAQAVERHVQANNHSAIMQLLVLAQDDEPAVAPVSDALYAIEAQRLRESGWLACVDMLTALGSDDDYHQWVTYQPSVVSGGFSETDDAGERRNVACHVRRAGDAGTAFKPLYAQVPMTNDEHSRQHQGGESSVYVRYQRLQGVAPLNLSRQAAQDWFDQQLAETRTAWAAERLAAALGVSDLAYARPMDVVAWAMVHELSLPDGVFDNKEVPA